MPDPNNPPPVRVLLVDDDERNLIALSEVLAPIAEVVVARSGREALRELLSEDFAVILLDVFMPDMDGYETAEMIRARLQTARIPIIFLSAVNKEVEHLNRGYAMGAVDYVFKPVEPLTLRSKVSVFVDLYRLRNEVAERTRAERALLEQNLAAEIERLKAERALREAEVRQAALLQALPLVLFELELDSHGRPRRTFVAGDLERIVGLDAADVASGVIDWEDRVDGRTLALTPEALAQPACTRVYLWTTSKGPDRYISELISPLGGGKWAGSLIDVTERQLLENQLVQAGKMDAIGQLTGGLAHDFNNLLAAIMAGLSLVENRVTLGEREAAIMQQTRHAAEKGAELIRRMMAFSHKHDLNPVLLDPVDLCETVGGLVTHALGGQFEVDWTCEVSDLGILADRSQLELALMNLIINARDAMPDGGTISVSFKAKANGSDGDPFIVICVSDTGTGIAEDQIARITEPFFTTKQVGKGTGLGLAMVAHFVANSGGRLDIDSALGEGTRVTIALPARLRDADGPAQTGADPRPKNSLQRVMLVDDDALVRGLIREELIDVGCEVEDFGNGEDALARITECGGQFDLLITDFSMPGMNGLKLIELARAAYPSMGIALVTGYAEQNLSDLSTQGIPVFAKPFKLADVLGACQKRVPV